MSTDSLTSDWYYAKRDDSASRQGPLAWQDLYLRAQTGEFGPQDLVWNPQLPDWTPAAQIPGLFPATIAPPAAVTSRQPHQGRPGWLLPVLIPVVVLVLVVGMLPVSAFAIVDRPVSGSDAVLAPYTPVVTISGAGWTPSDVATHSPWTSATVTPQIVATVSPSGVLNSVEAAKRRVLRVASARQQSGPS